MCVPATTFIFFRSEDLQKTCFFEGTTWFDMLKGTPGCHQKPKASRDFEEDAFVSDPRIVGVRQMPAAARGVDMT